MIGAKRCLHQVVCLAVRTQHELAKLFRSHYPVFGEQLGKTRDLSDSTEHCAPVAAPRS